MAETIKARPRRERERFFDRYLQGAGIDIGCGDDPVTPDCVRWDRPNDAYAPQGEFDWVYSSHCLEHLDDPERALRAWWSVLKPGGHLIVIVPHRDLYEKKVVLPSLWNGEHKHFWVPAWDEPPCTRGLFMALMRAVPRAKLLRLTVEDEGWDSVPVTEHSHGEYSIELVVRK
jgi:SAM-dependent methyltransferase